MRQCKGTLNMAPGVLVSPQRTVFVTEGPFLAICHILTNCSRTECQSSIPAHSPEANYLTLGVSLNPSKLQTPHP